MRSFSCQEIRCWGEAIRRPDYSWNKFGGRQFSSVERKVGTR
jgi:hypothetical protein